MKIDLPLSDGKVVSIAVAKRYKWRGDCEHLEIEIDRDLSVLECCKCHKAISPIEWLAKRAEDWSFARMEAERMKKITEEMNAKIRCKCEHCGKMTKVPKP